MGGPGSGRDGISRQFVIEAERLLEAGGNVTDVARRLALSRDTVAKIRAGEHFLQPLIDADRYRRCPGCGGLVQGDCLLCELRRAGL